MIRTKGAHLVLIHPRCANLLKLENALKANSVHVPIIESSLSIILRNTRLNSATNGHMALNRATLEIFVPLLIAKRSFQLICCIGWNKTATFTCFISKLFGVLSMTKCGVISAMNVNMRTIGRTTDVNLTSTSTKPRNSAGFGPRRRRQRLTVMDAT